jgi:hypothetical protein
MWLFRAFKNCNENWRYDLHKLAPDHNPLLIRSRDICVQRHPVLRGIVLAYEEFYGNFCKKDNNYRYAQIFDNKIFCDPGTLQPLGKNFFGNLLYDNYTRQIRVLTYDKCFNNNIFKSLQEFRDDGLPLTLVTWMRLRNLLLRHNRGNSNIKAISISEFVNRWRKGGRVIRLNATSHHLKSIDTRNLRSFNTFTDLIGFIPDEEFNVGNWYSSWNTHSLSNDFRTFIYNSRFNSLPLNNRLNSYLQEVDPSCTFCNITHNRPAPRDSVSHCFLHCNSVQSLLTDFIMILGINLDINSSQFAKLYWFGYTAGDVNITVRCFATSLIFDGFRYVLFKNRQRRHLPSSLQLQIEVATLFKWICRYNNKIFQAIQCTFPNTIFLQAIG